MTASLSSLPVERRSTLIRNRSFAMGLAALVACGMSAVVAASPADAAAKKPATLTVLVTKDDSVAAPGIDALVQALRTVKNT